MIAAQVQDKTIAALMASPLAKAAVAAAEAERHDARRDLLARIAAAERDAAAAGEAASAPIPELRERHAAALRALRIAARELDIAEAEASTGAMSRDAGIGALRSGLRELGGNDIEALRVFLSIEARAADSLDDWRPQVTYDAMGRPVSSVLHVDGGAGRRRAQIAEALRELDALEFDAEVSPTTIARRCDEIRRVIEASPAPPAGAERVGPMGSLRDRAQTWLAKRMAALAAAS